MWDINSYNLQFFQYTEMHVKYRGLQSAAKLNQDFNWLQCLSDVCFFFIILIAI